MRVQVRLRPYQNSDQHRIIALRQRVFGDADIVRLRPGTWVWQFRRHPLGPGFIRLAEAGGRVIAQHAAIPSRLNILDQAHILAFTCDIMTHPDFRKQNLFVDLGRQLYTELATRHCITMAWGFPNRASLPGFCRKLDWHRVGTLPLYVKPLGLPGPRPPAREKQRHGTSDLEFAPITVFDPSFDRLWQAACGPYPVIQIRDHRYLNWRYVHNKAFGYRPFKILYQGHLRGYGVLRQVRIKSILLTALVDLFPMPILNDPITLCTLRFAGLQARELGSAFLACVHSMVPPRLMRKAGFFRVPEFLNPRPWHLGCRFDPTALPVLGDIQNWYVTLGDADIV